MDLYLKTDLGIQTLKQRSFQLNARQRQLLLLIGTEDFKILNDGLKQRLATPERLQELENLGLIFNNKINDSNSTPPELIESNLPNAQNTEANSQTENEPFSSNITASEKLVENAQSIKKNAQITAPTDSHKPELAFLSFDEIKLKMMNSLQIHCGLMAKQLIVKIQQAISVRDIKFCQMQWITTLQESRISPSELNQTMQQINYSLQHLQSSS